MDRKSGVLLTFDFPGPEDEGAPHLPRVLRNGDAYLIPFLQRVPRKQPLHYAGRFHHRDFEHPLGELEPTDPDVLDQLLDTYGISLIGCDPHTYYEQVRV